MPSLSTTIKSIQDIMRKDVGVDGDAQRIGQLVWLLFLKIWDDREQEIELMEDGFISPLVNVSWTDVGGETRKAKDLRWRAWAADPEGDTGDKLLTFVNDTLFPALKGMEPGPKSDDRAIEALRQRRALVKSVFEDAYQYMKSGTLLRQVVNKVHEAIDFNDSKSRHLFGDIYEQVLKDLQGAGNAGEYYTPRAVTQFAVDMVNPRLGEVVLDPACGTGGFLACTIEHVRKHDVKTPEHEATLQASIRGVEKKPLPHLLCTTNLIVHGIDVPTATGVRHDNTLARPLRDIGPRDRVDVIVTNPPFGGMEEDGIENNFPSDFRTRETADLFLLLIVELLKDGGRAAVVLPDGTLFGEGVKARVRERLLTECDVHTVIRFPKGVFEPYTDIATNLIFFTKGRPTSTVWFYEHPLPQHRAHLKGKSYSATDGIQMSEFGDIKAWWKNRESNDRAWQVSIDELRECEFDLAQNHPKHAKLTLPGPASIINVVRSLQDESEGILGDLEASLARLRNVGASMVRLGDLIARRPSDVRVDPDVVYRRPRVQLHFRGARVRDEVPGREIGSKNQTLIRANDLLFSRIDAHNGAMAIVSAELDGAIATNDFPVFAIRRDRIVATYLRYCLFQPAMLRVYKHLSRGSTNRRRLNIDKFLELRIPLPADLGAQEDVANTLHEIEQGIDKMRERSGGIEEALEDLTGAALHYVFEP